MKYPDDYINKVICGDCLEVMSQLPEKIIQACITSPPYWGLRDYGVDGQLGLEKTPEEYVEKIVAIFREVWRVLKDDGTLWLNLGDSYAGSWGNSGSRAGGQRSNNVSKLDRKAWDNNTQRPASSYPQKNMKPKDLVGIPWMVAFALRADSWYLRQDIIWHKPNPMPESVTDRCTKAHEYIFLLTKSRKYYCDMEAIKEPVSLATINRMDQDIENQIGSTRAHAGGKNNGNMKAVGHGEKRNKRSVWTVSTKPFKEAHFATYPEKLIEPCVLAGSPEQGIILDPFIGSGTTGKVTLRTNRKYIGIELNPEYCKIAEQRLAQEILI